MGAPVVKEYITINYCCYYYMSAPVLLNELEGKIRCKALQSILSVVPNEFNKFNNTETRMQDSINHMTLIAFY